MEQKDAIDLLANPHLRGFLSQRWADLGCGSGTFTTALATLLPPGSTVYAVDKDTAALAEIQTNVGETTIRPSELDFVRDAWPANELDGILMANSLHYVRDKQSLIERFPKSAKKEHLVLIVEYDTDKSNPWVPYPASYRTLSNLFLRAGYGAASRLTEKPSRFHRTLIYSALFRWPTKEWVISNKNN